MDLNVEFELWAASTVEESASAMYDVRAGKRYAIVTIADEKFLPAACCTLSSASRELSGFEPVELILVATDVSDQQIDEAKSFLSSGGVKAKVIQTSSAELLGSGLKTDDRLPLSTYVRLRLDDILQDSFEKVLYLDADTRVMAPLGPLFQTQFDGMPLAATRDIYMYVQDRLAAVNAMLESPATTDYFNSGVMLMNWPAVLAEQILARSLDFARQHADNLKAYDQDALNAVVAGRFVPLDPRWNLIHYYYQNGGNRQAWIKHYTGEKPWSHRRPSFWKSDAAWYRTSLQDSPWPEFVAAQSPIGQLRARDVRRRIRNYNRVLGTIFIPSLQPPDVRQRALQFLRFNPEEVVATAHYWMDHPART
jgi:lipopolysaccharide biosynthesis glycosyltransferase